MLNSLAPLPVSSSSLSTSENNANLRQDRSSGKTDKGDSMGQMTIPQRRKYQPVNSTSLGSSKRIPLIPLRTKDDDPNGIQVSLSRASQNADDETVSFSLDVLLGASNGERPSLSQENASFRHVDRKVVPSSLTPTKGVQVDEPEASNDPELSLNHTMKIPENILEIYKLEAVKIRGTKIDASVGSVFLEDEDIEIRTHAPNTVKSLSRFLPSVTNNRSVPRDGKLLVHKLNTEENAQDMLDWFEPLLHPNKSFVKINERRYLRLDVLGRGGSTTVYRVMSQEGDLFAYKHIQVHGSEENCMAQCRSYSNEIELLMKLKGSRNIIELLDFSIDLKGFSVSMIMEAGEIDLARVITNRSGNYDGFFARTVWREMLTAVEFIHDQRIVHSGKCLEII